MQETEMDGDWKQAAQHGKLRIMSSIFKSYIKILHEPQAVTIGKAVSSKRNTLFNWCVTLG